MTLYRLTGLAHPRETSWGFQSLLSEKSAKSLRGLGPGVIEIIENHRGATYRAVYTVRFEDRLYVLHCFQKKSKKGTKTPRHDIDLIKERLKRAQTDYEQRQRKRRAKE